jgi:probable F420-dependent oxidoreductase
VVYLPRGGPNYAGMRDIPTRLSPSTHIQSTAGAARKLDLKCSWGLRLLRMPTMNLGKWGFALETDAEDAYLAAAAEIEYLGFTTLWLAGGQLDRLERLGDLIRASDQAIVASSIISPDVYEATQTLELYEQMETSYPGRLLVGLGAPQEPNAISALHKYTDELDSAPHPIPRGRRILAAIGPRKLDIARKRFCGAVPILVTPAYTAAARAQLGRGSTLAVGQFAVLDDNPDSARETARIPLQFLLHEVRGYANSARRQGFTDEDIDTLSDRVVDELVVWGSPADVVARADQQRGAGADHVQFTILHSAAQPGPLEAARVIAPLLAD